MQFDSDDFDLAIRILRNLNVIGHDDLTRALTVAYSKLARKAIEVDTKITNVNTLFAGMGEDGKSGAMISYNFRLNSDISEENFLDDDSIRHLEQGRIENIVLLDDVISTGNQAIKEIQKVTEKLTPFGVKNIFILTACGMREAIQKVQEETKAYTFSAFEYDKEDTVKSFDSPFYQGIPYDERAKLLSRLEKYGEVCYKSNPLGYHGIGALIAFYYNTPNSSLPIIWSDNNSWIPLFKRVRRINGIDSHYKQLDKSLKKKVENIEKGISTEQTASCEKDKPGLKELKIFVEGKWEEVFFRFLVRQAKLDQQLGYEKIDVIALGGVGSAKLLDELQKVFPHSLFIFDENYRGISRNRQPSALTNQNSYTLNPSYMCFFDINAMYKDEKLIKHLPPIESLDMPIDNRVLHESEIALFKRYPIHIGGKRLEEIASKYVDNNKVIEFINWVKGALNKTKDY